MTGHGKFRARTVFVATRETTRVYRSVEEVPADLRRQLKASTSGPNSAQIIIADSEGRRRITNWLKELEEHPSFAKQARRESRKADWRLAFELTLIAAFGLALWMLVTIR